MVKCKFSDRTLKVFFIPMLIKIDNLILTRLLLHIKYLLLLCTVKVTSENTQSTYAMHTQGYITKMLAKILKKI